MLNIQRLQPEDTEGAARWDSFVMAAPTATFFHRAGWQRIISDIHGHRTYFLYAERSGAIEGVLPLAHVDSFLFGNGLVSLPFAVYGGVAASTPEAAAALEGEAERLARNLKVDHLELRHVAQRHPDWPTQDIYVTFRRTIPEVLDDRMVPIPAKRRNMVRKAIKLGLSATWGDSVDEFFPLYAENSRDHGSPALPRRHFEKLVEEFAQDCEILIVRGDDGTPLSAMLSFYFRGEAMAYYAGESARARPTAANDLKYWELMKRAVARGCRVFDMGRSKSGTGSFEFKRTWGFEPQPLHYEYVLLKRQHIPQNNPLNPKYRAMIALWRKLPIGVANVLGQPIVRNLG
ncbi:MAG: peptidoglycan bridge formation protein FemAB [Rhodocyclaceae bacterium]|nr:peptidoglycan bridge formation protein FemAB [Rhodocyclaceae bacterium]